jgi:ribosomal protein L11 methyltransferase
MSWLELSFELGALDPASAEAACVAAGALAVTFSDASDQPVLEPAPGELRLWQHTRLQALFDAQQANAALIATLASVLGLPASQLAARAVGDRVWEREWLRDFHALRFGERLWICPRHESVADPQAVVVRLDPGLAFGTGTHASTALCLQWLDGATLAGTGLAGRTVVDYGCGAGALAIAALKLGARRAVAFDIDPQALLATGENAADNGVSDRLQLCGRAADIPPGCDLLLANIIADVLISLRLQFATLLQPGADLLLAGLLDHQEAEVASAFAKWFDIRRYASRDGWVALAGKRL